MRPHSMSSILASLLAAGPFAGGFTAGGQIIPRFRRPSRRYKVNGGTRAQQRHRRQIERGLISEDSILRGVE